MIRRIGCVSLALLAAACSSMSSIENPKGVEVEGLTYFMPKKDFLVVVTISDQGKKVSNVTLGATAAYADTSTQYVMNYRGSLIGTNKLEVQVSESGLLSTTKTSSESKISEAFQGAAAAAGALKGYGIFAARPEFPKPPRSTLTDCPTDGEHAFVFPGDKEESACGVTITFKKLTVGNGVVGHGRDPGQSHSGLYYRLDEPYLVRANGEGINRASVVFTPSGSKVYFLPVAKSLFAKNEAELTIADGVLKKYKQESDGELIALLKIPADVASAYFSAIGSTLDAFASNDGKAAAALAESIKLELAKKKFDACLAAIEAKDPKAIETLKCGE